MANSVLLGAIPAGPATQCGKLLNLMVPRFPHQLNGHDASNNTYLLRGV